MQIQDGENIYTEDRQCRYMTQASYPDKMTVEEFFQEILDAQTHFINNVNKYTAFKEPKYAEDWMEKFQSWMEMEKPH